jgi:phage baseplate assembly protein W
MTDYQREVVTGYRTAWVSAMIRGDRDFAKEIEQSVKDWNNTAKGTALEIRNFVNNSQRALKEARRPAVERTLRSASNTAEKDLQRMIDLMTLN